MVVRTSDARADLADILAFGVEGLNNLEEDCPVWSAQVILGCKEPVVIAVEPVFVWRGWVTPP